MIDSFGPSKNNRIVTKITIEQFLELGAHYPVIDARSEGEYAHARIPGAVSIPIFNNEERKEIGTAYKRQSRQIAIKIGMKYFGAKMVHMVEEAEQLFAENAGPKTVVVHCWRGGMRSGAVAWLLDLYGFKVYTLVGGYKAYRRWALEQFQKNYPIQILGGFTGSGKTYVLDQMRKLGQTVIDLEGIANHKGSAFGAIGMPPQPSQEMFENMLALELHSAALVKQEVNENVIWMEDESQRIGTVNIPTPLFLNMRGKPIYFLNIPFDERLKHIMDGYGSGDKEKLIAATSRIEKRLGPLETKTAINDLEVGRVEDAFRILLKYYDKQYLKGLCNRDSLNEQLRKVNATAVDAPKNAQLIIQQSKDTIHV